MLLRTWVGRLDASDEHGDDLCFATLEPQLVVNNPEPYNSGTRLSTCRTATMLKPQYSLAHHVCLEILFVLTYTIRPSYRKHGFVAVALPALYALCFTKLTGATPGAFIDMGLGARLGQILLFSSNDFLLHNAQQEYRAIGDTRDIPSAPFLTRLRWAIQVWANPRGIGWTHEAKGLPPKTKETSRARFIKDLVVELVLWMAAYDVNKWILRQSPYYTQGQKLEGWQSLWRLSACGYAFNIIIKLGIQRSQLALICSCLGVTEPRDWPQTFGSLKYTYSLATFWGYVIAFHSDLL